MRRLAVLDTISVRWWSGVWPGQVEASPGRVVGQEGGTWTTPRQTLDKWPTSLRVAGRGLMSTGVSQLKGRQAGGHHHHAIDNLAWSVLLNLYIEQLDERRERHRFRFEEIW